MKEALLKKGFCFIEVLTPCPTTYSRRNKLGDGLDMMKFYKENSTIKHFSDPAKAAIRLGSRIIVGKFVEKKKPTFSDSVEENLRHSLGRK